MLNKLICFFFISFVLLLASSFSPKFTPTFGIKTVVIDAGHGGKDPGCHGSLYKEKDVALAVALKLGKYIEDNLKDVKVIYTRKTDVFVELQERAMIANRAKADLFICVHCNSACVRDKVKKKDICRDQVHGAETYVMGIKNEKGKLDVAKRENASILLEDNYVQKYQGFDPNSDESYIIMSMFNDTYLNQSLSFAAKAQKQYATKAGREDHGVKRASLWVLWRTYMPAVLTEIGYLTNKREELFLGSEKGQDYIAAGLFRAFREYKDDIEGTAKKYNDDIENQEPYHLTKEDSLDMIATAAPALVDDSLNTETVSEKKDEVKLDAPPVKKEEEKPIAVVEKKKENKAEPVADKKKEDKKTVDKEKNKKNKPVPVTDKNKDDKKEVVAVKRKEDRTMPLLDSPTEPAAEAPTNIIKKEEAKTPVEEKKKEEKKEEKKEVVVEKKESIVPAPIVGMEKNEKKEPAINKTTEVKPLIAEKKKEEQKPEPLVIKEKQKEEKKEMAATKPEVDKANKVEEPKKTETENKKEPLPENKKEAQASDAPIIYKVQFLSSGKKIPLSSDKFKGVEKPGEYMDNGTYKYTAGEFTTKKEAANLQNEMRKNGFNDAFVISTQDGKRIPFK